jgi:hypothetical protein
MLGLHSTEYDFLVGSCRLSQLLCTAAAVAISVQLGPMFARCAELGRVEVQEECHRRVCVVGGSTVSIRQHPTASVFDVRGCWHTVIDLLCLPANYAAGCCSVYCTALSATGVGVALADGSVVLPASAAWYTPYMLPTALL